MQKISPYRDFSLSLFLSISVLCPYFFVQNVLAFAFCPYFTTQIYMLLAGFKPAIPGGQRPQTYALDRAATGIGSCDPRTFQPAASCYTGYTIPASQIGQVHI